MACGDFAEIGYTQRFVEHLKLVSYGDVLLLLRRCFVRHCTLNGVNFSLESLPPSFHDIRLNRNSH